jgi:hypothetical protein
MAIVHSTSPDEAQTLKERLSNISLPHPVSISKLGPALGVHGGPGTLLVAVRQKVEDLAEKAKAEISEKRLFSLPSLPDIKLPKLRFASDM